MFNIADISTMFAIVMEKDSSRTTSVMEFWAGFYYRDGYEFNEKEVPESFSLIQDASNNFRWVYCSDKHKSILTYCEGDIYLQIYNDDLGYRQGLQNTIEYSKLYA